MALTLYNTLTRDVEPFVGVVQRRHQRWTPAGNVGDRGTAKNWFIEITGISAEKPYLALEIEG